MKNETAATAADSGRVISVAAFFGPARKAEVARALDEIDELARANEMRVVAAVAARRPAQHAATFVGGGKAEEIARLREELQAEAVLFNREIAPAQTRNLENAVGCRIIDRTELILEIFARRATTFEGRLQVELAAAKRNLTRLVRGWTHLERQRGGIGLRGGPGEKQIEIDRRLLAAKVRKLEKRLAAIAASRALARRRRRRERRFTAALVGCTNAGKSALFNLLTGAGVSSRARLFDTLDSTARAAFLGAQGEPGAVSVIDTVGFLRDLPHELVAGFRATLDDAATSDLLLHVVDCAADDWREAAEVVGDVLRQIGADEIPRLRVMNKIDLRPDFSPETARFFDGEEAGCDKMETLWVSCKSGAGITGLRRRIAEIANESSADCESSRDRIGA